MATHFNLVAIDNLGRDYNGGKSERLIASKIQSEDEAKVMADAWNKVFCGHNFAGDFAVVRPADKPLYRFEGY